MKVVCNVVCGSMFCVLVGFSVIDMLVGLLLLRLVEEGMKLMFFYVIVVWIDVVSVLCSVVYWVWV